jgi:arginine/ornithine N-succinyltransferase beta subunit
MSHRFVVGQTVMFTPAAGEVIAAVAEVVVLRLLPKEGLDYQYHVQIEPGRPARSARENQLQAIAGTVTF